MNPVSISAKNLVKEFDLGFRAVKGLSFEICEGESVAFLGQNGAGKSTTIKMLCGILSPTSGKASVAGFESGTKESNLRLGLVFGTRSQLFMHMKVVDCLDLVAEIYFVTGNKKKKRIQFLSEVFEIVPYLEKRVKSLSLGERMRCEVVAALIHEPRVLLADEPTIGLDVIAKNKLRELILKWQKEEKTTLMLTSHDLSDVEALCERCILIDHGEKKFDGTLSSLKGDLSDVRRFEITVNQGNLEPAKSETGIKLLGVDGYQHRYETKLRDIGIRETLTKLSDHYGNHLQDIQIGEVSLEEVLSQIYRNQRQ